MSLDPHLERLIEDARQAPKLSVEAERECIRAWQQHRDRSAAQRIALANLRHVVFIALKFRNYGMQLSDLISEGNIGLLKALDRFDETRGVRFSTYAVYWIRAQVVMSVLDSWSLLSGPRGALNSRVFFRLRRERARLSSVIESQGVAQRLAFAFGVTETRMQEMLSQIDNRGVSLDAQQPGTTFTLLDELSTEQDQEAMLERAEEHERLGRALDRARAVLDPREVVILERRLMADPEDRWSLSDIGRHFGVSRERVRQIEVRAVAKLRDQARRENLDAFGIQAA